VQIVVKLGDRYINLEDLLGECSVQPKDRKVNTKIKKQDNFKNLLIRRKKKETIEEFRARITL